jgi:hypothetical protein
MLFPEETIFPPFHYIFCLDVDVFTFILLGGFFETLKTVVGVQYCFGNY